MSNELIEFVRRLPRIEVLDVVETSTSKTKEGETYERRSQVGYLVSVDDYGVEERQRLRISLQRDHAPFAPGVYTVTGSCFAKSKYGDPELSRYLTLIPIPEALVRLNVPKAA